MYEAADQSKLAAIELLLGQDGIEVNKARTEDGATPLYIACYHGHVEAIKLLLAHDGLEVNKARTDDGATPLYTSSSCIIDTALNFQAFEETPLHTSTGLLASIAGLTGLWLGFSVSTILEIVEFMAILIYKHPSLTRFSTAVNAYVAFASWLVVVGVSIMQNEDALW